MFVDIDDDGVDYGVRQALEAMQRQTGGHIEGNKLLPLNAEFNDLVRERAIDIDSGARLWFALLCHPLHEHVAHAHLTGRRFKVYLPTVPRVTTRGVRRTKVTMAWPMFPGYLFIRLNFQLDQGRLRHVRAAPGVHKFLQFEDGYGIIPDREMQRVFDVEQGLVHERENKQACSKFDVGEHARISEGPFSGLNCEIAELDDDDRIKVLIALMGRYVPTDLSESDLEKL